MRPPEGDSWASTQELVEQVLQSKTAGLLHWDQTATCGKLVKECMAVWQCAQCARVRVQHDQAMARRQALPQHSVLSWPVGQKGGFFLVLLAGAAVAAVAAVPKLPWKLSNANELHKFGAAFSLRW